MQTILRKGPLHSVELIFKDYIPSPTNLVAKEATIEIGENGLIIFSLKFVKRIDDEDYQDAEDNLTNLLSIKIWDDLVLKKTQIFLKNKKITDTEFIVLLSFRKMYKKSSRLTSIKSEIVFETN